MNIKTVIALIVTSVLFTIGVTIIVFSWLNRDNDSPYQLNQTSASYLVKQAQRAADQSEGQAKEIATQKLEIIFDIYIKARSYAILNKIFFWLSVCSAICVLLWPSITVVLTESMEKWKWLKSATIQTTITGIAALTFSFYSQYKDKQVYTESLMRYALYQESSIPKLSLKVSEELARIDRGFSFSSIIKDQQ